MASRELRFVLLRHECPDCYRDGPHWDLMLERADKAEERRLATWSLLSLPATWAHAIGVAAGGESVEATQLADHRVAYLDYEGPVSGNRGEVSRVACGVLRWLESSDRLCRAEVGESSLPGGVLTLSVLDAPVWRLSVESAASA